jgi:GTP-binding protein
MQIKSAALDIVCGVTSKLPDTCQPEIAFAGKSNVGKSSLINGMLNRKALARTSSQPGKTQTINFYHINEAFYLVDLPGYGYTTASVNVRQSWGRMIERYLKTSGNLKAVFLLLDIRHAPNANDRQMYDWVLANGYTPIVIATKLDKIKRSQVQKQLKLLRDTLGMEKGAEIFPTVR